MTPTLKKRARQIFDLMWTDMHSEHAYEYVREDFVHQIEDAIRDAVADVQADAWKPIETAPKDKVILLWGRYWSDEQGWFNHPLMGQWVEVRNRWEAISIRYDFGVRPTRWQPLPPPPKEADNDNS